MFKLRHTFFALLLFFVFGSTMDDRIVGLTNTGQRAKVVRADQFPGADLGAKVNAADKALGTATGEIVLSRGGRIATQIVVSANHTLRVEPGTYVSATSNTPILLKSGAKLVGTSWEAIILEPTAKGQFTVISAFNHAQRNGAADSDILIKDVQIKGANPDFHSAPQAISLGNCSRCTVDHVWVNGTRSIGVQLGGASFDGHWAEDSKVINSQFTRVASQNLALVNGRNIVFENNRFLTTGQAGGPGSSIIDLEPNDHNDHIENVRIVNNYIDLRKSPDGIFGNGILVQSGSGTPHVGPILIEGNTLIGGEYERDPMTNVMSNGIYVFGSTMKNVTIRNNRVTRTGQCGLNIEGSRFVVTGNHFTNVGGGGTPGFRLTEVSDSVITDNTFTYTGGPADARVEMIGNNRNNVIRNNPGMGFPPNIR